MIRCRHPLLHQALAVALGAVFLYASHDKILDPTAFARIVYHYRLAGPSSLIPPLAPNLWAVTLPWVEAVAGLLLVLQVWRREAAAVTAGLLVVFLVAVSYALAVGIDLQNCGCFNLTSEGRRAGLTLILGDIGLLAMALCLVLLPPRPVDKADA